MVRRLLEEKSDDEYIIGRINEVTRASLSTHGVDILPAIHGTSPDYTAWIQAAFPRVIQLIEHSEARSEDYMACTDNAISDVFEKPRLLWHVCYRYLTLAAHHACPLSYSRGRRAYTATNPVPATPMSPGYDEYGDYRGYEKRYDS